jgi:hypothetical protein
VASSTIQQRLTRQRRSSRTWLIYAIPAALLALRAGFDFAFDTATGHAVSLLGSLTDGQVAVMAIAGLLTVAYLPLAVEVGVEDRKRWYGRPAPAVLSPEDTGVIHMTTRPRTDSGHKVARRPLLHWIRRIPLAIAALAALLFWPMTGAAMSKHWLPITGGDAFTTGWRIGLGAAAVGMLFVLAEPWISAATARKHRLPRRTVRWATNVIPLLATAAALTLVIH